jgi:DJ-1/PfpI family
VEAVRAAYDRGARIASICSGAFILAAAGLLDGRRATVHWMHASLLAKRYPKVTVDPSVLYTDDGDVLTSAGTAAGLDLCLHLVRRSAARSPTCSPGGWSSPPTAPAGRRNTSKPRCPGTTTRAWPRSCTGHWNTSTSRSPSPSSREDNVFHRGL